MDVSAIWQSAAVSAATTAKSSLATDFVTGFARIKDQKLEPVIGKHKETVKPRMAELWRSGRTLRVIAINLKSLQTIAGLAHDGLPAESTLDYTIATAIKSVESLSGDLGTVAAGSQRADVIFLADAVGAAEDRALAEFPVALDVTIGFSSLDGD